MYRLYSSPGSCSLAPHVVLRELGLPYELERVSIPDGQNRTPEFLEINPRGQVPVLVTPLGQVVREGGAILLHLLCVQDNTLFPLQAGPRAVALEWLMFANASLHPLYGRMFFFAKQLGDGAKENALVKATRDSLQTLWDDIEGRLEGRSYLCGEDYSAADTLVSVIANWNSKIPLAPELGPNTTRMVQKVMNRPAYQEALAAEEAGQKEATAA